MKVIRRSCLYSSSFDLDWVIPKVPCALENSAWRRFSVVWFPIVMAPFVASKENGKRLLGSTSGSWFFSHLVTFPIKEGASVAESNVSDVEKGRSIRLVRLILTHRWDSYTSRWVVSANFVRKRDWVDCWSGILCPYFSIIRINWCHLWKDVIEGSGSII